MIVTKLRTNHLKSPIGYELEPLTFSWIVENTTACFQKNARIEIALDAAFQQCVFDSGFREDISALAYSPCLSLEPCTRYFWRVTVTGDNGEQAVSPVDFFETGIPSGSWQAPWITPDWPDTAIHPELSRTFLLSEKPICARLYCTGLGLYVPYINNRIITQEVLLPGFHAYDAWVQYQTFDITEHLLPGENTVSFLLGNGEAKGRFAFPAYPGNLYTDRFLLTCEVRLWFSDGRMERIFSDACWRARPSQIMSSGIYDGEIRDAAKPVEPWSGVRCVKPEIGSVSPRLSPPVQVCKTFPPRAWFITPKGETVIDTGQNLAGWLRVRYSAPRGTCLRLTYFETLQDGCVCTDNLRTARQTYVYTSDGEPAEIQPMFTYFGFRYIQIEGWIGELDLSCFTVCAVHSALDETVEIETSDAKFNRFFQNVCWSQRSNFLDVPTDCPQRDERLGWTGDAQIFCGTAMYNMDCYAFFSKYLHDLWLEQCKENGRVPNMVPNMLERAGQAMGLQPFQPDGTAGWGDAAVIIPWKLYCHYGDKGILVRQFASMCAWVDHLQGVAEKNGNPHLWLGSSQLGDWLSLDTYTREEDNRKESGAFIASVYYFISASLTAKAAAVLGYCAAQEKYAVLSDAIRLAIQKHFFTQDGTLKIPTQTAYALALWYELSPDPTQTAQALYLQLQTDNFHLTTGFLGTPLLCPALSKFGMTDIAYRLLFQEDYPSWLYEIQLGATTIWERWNSLLPDGHLSDTGMNSLNHYAYGAVMEWVYADIFGLRPAKPGVSFREVSLSLHPSSRLPKAVCTLETPAGKYKIRWEIHENRICLEFEIPFDAKAHLTLPPNCRGVTERQVDLIHGQYAFEFDWVEKGEYNR